MSARAGGVGSITGELAEICLVLRRAEPKHEGQDTPHEARLQALGVQMLLARYLRQRSETGTQRARGGHRA